MDERTAVSGGGSSPIPPPRGRRFRLSRTARVVVSGVAAAAATAAALTALGSVSRGTAAPHSPPPTAGNFALPLLGHPGQRISLSAYAGKPVIVNFFASWCHPCQQETPLIARFYAASGKRVAIIGVDENDRAPAALAFIRASKVAYPVAVDGPSDPTASAYGLIGLPQTFFLDAQHRIVKRVSGAVTLHDLQAGLAMIDPTSK